MTTGFPAFNRENGDSLSPAPTDRQCPQNGRAALASSDGLHLHLIRPPALERA